MHDFFRYPAFFKMLRTARLLFKNIKTQIYIVSFYIEVKKL